MTKKLGTTEASDAEHLREKTESGEPVKASQGLQSEDEPAKPSVARSPPISSIVWGRVEVGGSVGKQKDAKLWPGGGRAWDWGETGTRHSPGIQVADVEELLDRGATAVVLSRGMDEKLGVPQSTIDALEARGIEVHVAETRAAVKIYNKLASESVQVAGLFHSTC